MLKESEKYKEEDEKNRLRIEAKNELENYVYNARNSISQAETPEAKAIKPDVEKIVTATTEWLDNNTTASTEEYKDKKKEVEEELAPLMSKLYASGGGPPGAGMPGGMPDMSQFGGGAPPPGATEKGPTIEEVD
jgi:L1 cell adhesion molecule like protein